MQKSREGFIFFGAFYGKMFYGYYFYGREENGMAKVTDPIKIGAFTLKNRITMAPTVKFDLTDASGKCTRELVEHYKARAKGGCGLICVEATAVVPEGRFGPNHMGLWEDEQIEGHKALVKACHEEGAVVIIQLNHTGYGTNPMMGPSVGPSTLEKHGWDGKPYMTHGFTLDELHDMQKKYVEAAVRAKKAGYDGVQLHGCHSYLINQFASPENNLREDEYGGSGENRGRFGAEIIREIRKECGPDFLISVRTTGHDSTLADAIEVAEEYVKAGCEYLQVSTGMSNLDDLPEFKGGEVDKVPALGIYYKEHFKDRVPVSSVGGLNTPESVKYLIENDLVDTVDIGRAVLADPDFANAVINGTEYSKCFGCKACQFGPFTKHMCPANLKKNK